MEGFGQALIFMLLVVSIIVSIPALIIGLLGWRFAKKKDSNNLSARAAVATAAR